MVKRLFIATLVAISPLLAIAQGLIKGRVTDVRTGEPLIGAAVIVKSEKGTGVVTDVDGNFSLQTKLDAPLTLKVEYVGYRPLDVDVYDFEEPVEIGLADNSSRLNEVVVVGYGAQKRLELTSSISSVDNELLRKNNTSVEGALQGAVAGLNVTTTSGQPGAASIIRIRGGNSITGGNEPLYVIDGFIVYNDVSSNKTGARGSDATLDPLSFLNPSDIESIEVLKDVSATAIYGTRGANGVIIITTKKGSHGKNNINYSASFGWSTIAKKLDFLDAWQWADIWNELYENGEVGYRVDEPKATYNWQDAALQTAFTQEHQLSAVGGDEVSRYSISGSFKDQEGILLNTGLQRYAGRVNYERNVFKNLLIGVNASGAYNKMTGMSDRSSMFAANSWYGAISHTPYAPIYNEDGTFNYEPNPTSVDIYNGKVGNPISDMVNYQTETENTRLLGTGFAEWTIIPQLKLKASLGADISNTRQSYYAPSYTSDGLPYNGYASVGQTKTHIWQTEYTATYSNTFKKLHSLTILAGYTAQYTDRSRIATTAYGFSNDATGYDNLGAASTTQPSSSGHYISTLQSWISRFNYSYDSRYNASLTLRADGSSRFAKDKRWGWFPSLGLSWNIDREKWLHLSKDVDFIQLRASVGVVGNQEIGDYQFAANVVPKTVIVNNERATSYVISNKSNPDLKWETTTSYNVGLSSGFFKNRLTATLDFYYKKTSDLLLSIPVEQTTGFSNQLKNIGNVTNRGVEFAVNANLIQRKNLSWDASFNIAHNKNKVTNLGPLENIISGSTIIQEGEALGSFYGWKFDGIVQQGDELTKVPSPSPKPNIEYGDAKFIDVDGDGQVNQENDRVILGSIQPDFTYGLSTTLRYKDWSLLTVFQGSQGNEIYNSLRQRLESPSTSYNGSTKLLNRWTSDNPSTSVPKAYSSSNYSNYVDSRYVEDGSYFRLKNITLTYQLPVRLKKDPGARFKVFASATNLFTITSYDGYDPEVAGGIDAGAYPTARTFTLGVNLHF